MTVDQQPIRDVLKSLNPSVAHKAAESPEISEIYSPPSHAEALDADRALVVGGRGVGKSFWASVLANDEARQIAAKAYPSLNLENLEVELGFHEGAQGASTLAPTPVAIRRALEKFDDPAWIWRSVVLRALEPGIGPQRLTDRVSWLMEDPETYDELMYDADQELVRRKKRVLVVFDALDVLANDWGTIRRLTVGLARVALEMSSRKAVRLKLFMRKDQFEDMRRKTFADFSKLRTGAVELDWRSVDLYGALFARLWRDPRSQPVINVLGKRIGLAPDRGSKFPRSLQDNERLQQKLFSSFAGEFMGANEKRGRTYTWVPKHLADGHGETSLRSFFIALKEAAANTPERSHLAIDRNGINLGVLKASETRREEIKEDHPWVEDALEALAGLTVPCSAREILDRWRERDVVTKIRARSDPERPSAPIQLELSVPDAERDNPEEALLYALAELGVIEERSFERINVPDIFRVSAKIKRKGGIVPKKRS